MIAAVAIGAAVLVGLAAGYLVASRRRRRGSDAPDAVHRILLPFTGTQISRRALDAATRLAIAEDAVLMPAYLAVVPMQLPLECKLPGEAGKAMPMLEAIDQIASARGVPVDARVERGRSYRHALARLLEEERFDRVIVPSNPNGGEGLSGEDLVWLLEKAPAEVLILRPAPDDKRRLTADAANPHHGRPPRAAGEQGDLRR